ncbi:MAG: outer membrane lipoprotein-sorting protein [Desulfobacterales bacterium]|nr:outer membrane lipoprotein-sorting protein [Deltaproteobacteria bacterium]MBT8373439.1 outer membrane lipoprotein-sorting protein [Deltaproteobacteria bacterium]NNK85920.1 outer membrane lipoprotein-sorting protein [Desulfobacterales bacterium]NNL76311.1 outer membrane lipoprotein-sorting protein [Desulfobacterales bacterium]
MKKIFLIPFLLLSLTAQAENPSGMTIIKKVDENMSSETRVVISKMIIHSRRDTRTVQSKSWTLGDRKGFTEYLSPPREKGTKMLKLEDRLWIYSPTTDRIIKISGHMLRQSVMGSDLSYEDMMEDPRLLQIYDAKVTGTESIDNRLCWMVRLVAKKTDVAYHSRTLWVDQERYVPIKEELYAKSGKLLKKVDLKDFTRIDDRWFPLRMIFKDVLKTGEGTEFVTESIEFNVPIPKHIFSKAALRR